MKYRFVYKFEDGTTYIALIDDSRTWGEIVEEERELIKDVVGIESLEISEVKAELLK